MDSFDREKYMRRNSSTNEMSTSALTKSRHKKSSSSPAYLQSPTLAPTTHSSFSSSSTSGRVSAPSTPSLFSMASLPAVVLESDVEPLDLHQSTLSHLPSDHTASIFSTPTSSFFFGRYGGSASTTPAATPPPSPALYAASTNPSTSPNSPFSTPPPSPSPSFLATWHGRLPSIPRPSPMMPFRAAKKVVTSVTSVGTGLLPSKEQLGSIPVAGRILKHPVMDSTLTYIASKTTGGKGSTSKAVSQEDVHYRKLNKELMEHSMALVALTMEREERSKTIDDEAGDDAFELYLAAIETLVHALPFETCDPFRREAFETQLQSLFKDTLLDTAEDEPDSKQLRRRRRRRHREYHHQATSLIYQHSAETSSTGGDQGGNTISGSSRHPHEPQLQHKGQQEASSGRRTKRRRRSGRKSEEEDREGPTLSETIVSTAVQSAIRLKQSRIPDVIKSCFHASRLVLSKMDERFHLKERAWRLSKQSIEKAIELDQQYAIHEVVTETLFATVTGLVKAGIAYKETPGYSATKSVASRELMQDLNHGTPPALTTAVGPVGRSQNPQAILEKNVTSSRCSSRGRSGRRYSIIAEEEEEEETMFGEARLSRHDSRESSSSCFTTSSEESDSDDNSSSDDRRRMRRTFDWRYGLLSSAASGFAAPYYNDYESQRTGFTLALKGAASYFIHTLATSK
ncbi:hypothetical protein BGX34_001785 [Mortierella sp. NVP85]|nr:hypothetical protein BGX34_001785 [Mortierella sp. NVP85]